MPQTQRPSEASVQTACRLEDRWFRHSEASPNVHLLALSLDAGKGDLVEAMGDLMSACTPAEWTEAWAKAETVLARHTPSQEQDDDR